MTTPTNEPKDAVGGSVRAATDRPSLRGLGLTIGYDTGDEALRQFYVPALSRSLSYDRSVGYFRASAISAAARGVSRFVAGGGVMRLLIGAELGDADRTALTGAAEIPDGLARRLASELVPADEISEARFAVLAWLARNDRLQVKVAIPVDDDGVPVPPDQARPYFHEKIGILRDAEGDGVAFQGSINESDSAWSHNFESFSVYKSWDGSASYFDEWASRFERRWSGDVPGFKIYDLPDQAVRALLSQAPDEPPPARDPEEGPEPPPSDLLATFLAVAPRLVGSDSIAEATVGVRPFPHQNKVVARLAGTYPRSWLVADEVGLGKTISAGLSMRQLLLSGEVERALILAPAGVCRQWQDELFEKFGLWVPRYDRGRIFGAHPEDNRDVAPGENPYATEPLLLVSSHLARRPAQQRLILASPRLDLLVVDEAHHARRQGSDPDRYRPSRLLSLLDQVRDTGHTRATWLLTATPMQIDPIELIDLLRHVGLTGLLSDPATFERYYAELAKPVDTEVDWCFLARTTAGSDVPLDDADRVLLSRIEDNLGLVGATRIQEFAVSESPAATADLLGVSGRRDLVRWLHQRGPVGRLLTRHTRQTLRQYRAAGILREPIADRSVVAVPIPFTRPEEELYDGLDAVLDRLMQAHGNRQQAGFVLTIYRRRLTSSWAAILATLRRRLKDEALRLEEDEFLDEADAVEGVEADDGALVDDRHALPLTSADLAELQGYLTRLEIVTDTKFEVLRGDLDQARGSDQAVIVFTAFTDTLDYLVERLRPAYRSHLATYTGDGGCIWSEESGWQKVAKGELVEALRSGRVSVILATDAASEGLNLQVASYLINYDLPWNPMRVEQRIGRIDRIGQAYPAVTIRNYVIPGTVEESVYDALARRIDLFSGLVGRLQPILGATEAAFGRIFRAPRSERIQVRQQAIGELMARVDELQSTGIDLDPNEDPMPNPIRTDPPVDLQGLRAALVEDLAVGLDEPGKPATFRPDHVSRDPERWCALATYGHPKLEPILRNLSGPLSTRSIGPIAFAEDNGVWAAYRGDRIPPKQVHTLADLSDLGEAAAVSEAGELALSLVRNASARRNERLRRAEQDTREQWLNSMRNRFTALVRGTISATSALHARNGGLVEPRMVWMELRTDSTTAWRNADSLRQHLGLDFSALIPDQPTMVDPRSNEELEGVYKSSTQALNDLVREWIDHNAV